MLTSATAFAQRPVTGVSTNQGGPTTGLPTNVRTGNGGMRGGNDNAFPTDSTHDEVKGIEHHEDIPDSVLIGSVFRFHFTPLAVKILSIEHPDFEPSGAQYNDPLHAMNGNFYLSTGVIGQSHKGTFYTFDEGLGRTFMPSSQEGYRKTIQSVNFFQVQRPYTVLSYYGSGNKDNLVHVSHTQNVTERWNVSLDYDLIRAEGIYANSGTKNQYLDLTTNYYSKDSRYQVQGGLIFQKAFLNENGGMANDSVFMNDPSATLSGIPVASYDAASSTKGLTLFAHQSFNTVKQVEWYRPVTASLFDTITITDSLGATTTKIKSRDTIVGYDTLYPKTPHVLNTGVFGLDLEYGRFSRKYIDSVRFNHLNYNIYWTNDAYLDYRWHNPFKLTVGFKGSRAEAFMLSGEWRTISDFGPYAHAEIHPWYGTLHIHSELKGYANLAISDIVPHEIGADLYAKYLIPMDTIDRSRISIGIRGLVRPDEASYLMNAGGIKLKQFTLAYTRDSLVQVELRANDIAHMSRICLDPISGHLTTYHVSDMLFQARVVLSLRAGWFHYDMQQLVQYAASDQIDVPFWTSKNSVYADFSIFGNALRTQVGFDIRYLTSFFADAYDPATGLFYQQSDTKIGNSVWADFFVNLQIKRATLYAKVGHWNSLLEQHPSYFLLPHYADRRLGVFFGMTWKFFD